jgi:ADP-ribose pyrophosphatase YjhB (NUDIX family)
LGVGALVLRRDTVLLVERDHEPMAGWWSLPGGLVETGELLEAAVRREVFEETGLVVKPLGVVEIFERIMRDAAGAAEYHYVLVDYLCKPAGGTLEASTDARRAAFVPRRRLGEYHITEGSLGVIEKAFRQRRQYR